MFKLRIRKAGHCEEKEATGGSFLRRSNSSLRSWDCFVGRISLWSIRPSRNDSNTKLIRGFLVVFFILQTSHFILSAKAQTISGIINNYAHVIAIDTCLNTATVASTTGFNVGDSVLIIQMKGAIIDTTNTANYGTILSLNGAGQFEIASILSMPDLVTIRFSNKLLNIYDIKDGAVQLVRIPQYTNVTVVDTLRPKAWDPNTGTGGVLALEATGTLTLDAQLDASGLGFWGGGAANGGGGDSVTDYIFDGFFGPLGGEGGYKGEGIASDVGLYYNPYNAAGRGAPANGGGGGNAHNAGGGGGGNGDLGGLGGDQTDAQGFGRFANGGEPGKSLLPQTQPRLFMGGGGGGGQQNDHLGTDGGNGGGIIIIRAPIVISAFDTIQSNGLSPNGNSTSDGAGGGGAGGAIFIDVDSIFFANHTRRRSVASVTRRRWRLRRCTARPVCFRSRRRWFRRVLFAYRNRLWRLVYDRKWRQCGFGKQLHKSGNE